MTFVPLAQVVRSGFAESVHHGTALALAPGGSVVLAAGSPGEPIFPRSAVKPLQSVAMLRNGLDVDGALLALSAASHSGEAYHRDGVNRMLASRDLPPDLLANTADLPYGEVEHLTWQRLGLAPTPLAQNCSGKHAAMLLTCAENGWQTKDYLDPEHPLQRSIMTAVEDLTGGPVTATGIDGCGAPVFAITLTGLARAFARIATAAPDSPEGRVAAAIRDHPDWLGGTGREITGLIRGVPGLIAKDGAESVWAAALPDGSAVALKIGDGGGRAVPPVLASLLAALGAGSDLLTRWSHRPVLGHGEPVGAVESLLG